MSAPSDLIIGTHWNEATPAFDPKFRAIFDSQWVLTVYDDWYWTYYEPLGQRLYAASSVGTVALATTGTKWSLAQCIDFTAGGQSYLRVRDYSNNWGRPTDNRIQSIAMWVKPNYSGTPTDTVGFGGFGNGGWSAGTYRCGSLYHSATDGKLKYIQFGGTHGVAIGATASSSAWSPTSGTWYYLEICFDYLNGNQYLFIDGALVGTSSWTGALTNEAYTLIGAPDVSTFMGAEGPFVTDHYTQEVTNYDGLWHTSGYTVDDRPVLERMQDVGMPFILDYVRDIHADHEYIKTPIPGGASFEGNVGIDTTSSKFGAGALTTINTPTFPRLGWNGPDLIDALEDTGTISYWFKQIGTPTFADDQTHVEIRAGDIIASFSDTGKINIFQYTSGNLRVEINGSSTFAVVTLDAVNPFTVDTWHHVEVGFKIDGTDRHGWLFIDGILVDSQLTTGTGARVGLPGALCVGNNQYGNNSYADFSMDELLIFNTVQHTSGFTPPTEEMNFLNDFETDLIAVALSGDAMSGRLTQNIATGLVERE